VNVFLALVALAVAVAAIAWWRRRSSKPRVQPDWFDLLLGVRLFAYSMLFMLGAIAVLAIAFMLLVWSLK
jgi:hypothetical protein